MISDNAVALIVLCCTFFGLGIVMGYRFGYHAGLIAGIELTKLVKKWGDALDHDSGKNREV